MKLQLLTLVFLALSFCFGASAQSGDPKKCSECISACNTKPTDDEAQECLSQCLQKPICKSTPSSRSSTLFHWTSVQRTSDAPKSCEEIADMCNEACHTEGWWPRFDKTCYNSCVLRFGCPEESLK